MAAFRRFLPAIGVIAVFAAIAVPVQRAPIFPTPADPDCTTDSLGCGKRNDACKAYAGSKCMLGSVGDPDGDGCGCAIPTD